MAFLRFTVHLGVSREQRSEEMKAPLWGLTRYGGRSRSALQAPRSLSLTGWSLGKEGRQARALRSAGQRLL